MTEELYCYDCKRPANTECKEQKHRMNTEEVEGMGKSKEQQGLNIELLKAIRDKIASTPEAYDQETWGRKDGQAPCGTAACIAGWACVLSEQVSIEEARKLGRDGEIVRGGDVVHVSDAARQALGLDDREADVLFTALPEGEWEDYDDAGGDVFSGGWPEPFATQWRTCRTDQQSAIAVSYLDHIIETGKVLE